jgi:type II restriction enzyme
MSGTVNSPWLPTLINRWRTDPEGTYQSWFLWEERLKNFRSIRKGLARVIQDIESGEFGTAYRGSSLETVLHSVAEQRQIFKQADHAFVWKPKLRIPDIYESRENQLSFGRFLKNCLECTDEKGIVEAITQLDQKKIKGLGPSSANLLYFLHPTLVSPSNTAMVRGYNAITGAKVKLGSWSDYLAMRAGILRLNEEHRDLFSNDYGAIAAFLFDVGNERYPLPSPESNGEESRKAWETDLARVRSQSAASQKALSQAKENDRTHTEIQGWLRDLGLALGFQVWIASNDRSRPYCSGKLSDSCLTELPPALALVPSADTIRLIDVLWLKSDLSAVVAAFEVEHTTSIYSGILRLYDLALSQSGTTLQGLYLVAPDDREEDVRTQLSRPAFKTVENLVVRYLPYGEFEKHRESMARFGEGLKAIEAIAKSL